MTNNLAVNVNDLTFRYNHSPVVLANVNLAIAAGEFFGLIGPNGGGKTTLLKLLMGLLSQHNGNVTIFGKSPKKMRKIIGYVPQYSTFDRDFPISVVDVVLMGRLGHCHSFCWYPKHDRKIAVEMLERLEIAHLAQEPISNLSGGQMQRVLIARALACEPKLLLLDEPTANVDMHMEENVFELLAELKGNMTIIVVSHDVGFISKYVTNVACVNRNVFCHAANKLTSHLLEQLYNMPLKAVVHEHE